MSMPKQGGVFVVELAVLLPIGKAEGDLERAKHLIEKVRELGIGQIVMRDIRWEVNG